MKSVIIQISKVLHYFNGVWLGVDLKLHIKKIGLGVCRNLSPILGSTVNMITFEEDIIDHFISLRIFPFIMNNYII